MVPANHQRAGDGRLLQWMKGNGVPITRETYIELAWGSLLPDPWTKEDEAYLPGELQDWTQFEPDEQPGD
jgi:hypothetical protein